MDFDLKGQLDALDVPRRKGLQPLFEAVVNAFHSIEDAGRGKKGTVDIVVDREPLLEGLDGLGRIEGFTVIDNGAGFTETNLRSFFTAYSRAKIARGGKGVGRFTFLKVFERTEIDSHFLENEAMVSRSFSLPDTEQKPSTSPTTSQARSNRTSVQLIGMKDPWRSDVEQRLETIALSLIAHCIPYFVNPACPRIEIRDQNERLDLNDFFRINFEQNAKPRVFSVNGQQFTLKGFRLTHARAEAKHRILYAANYRGVLSETLSDIPSIGERHLDDGTGKKFVYLGFIEGDYLDKNTSAERLRFNFPRGDEDDSTLPGMPNLASIRAGAVEEVKVDLAPFLEEIADQASKRLVEFVGRAPELRPMLRYKDSFIHEVPPDASDSKINDILQKHKFTTEQSLRREGRELIKELTKQGLRPEDYTDRLASYLERSNELGKSALARYVAHRKVMLEFLEESLRKDKETGKYKLEDVVHRIIYPMQATSAEVPYEQQNLWMIDERLAFHWYLQSDKRLSAAPHLGSKSKDRPDLLIFEQALSFAADKEGPLNSVVIVEFKKPDRTNYGKEDPADQAHRLVRQIRAGKLKDRDGRPIVVRADDIPAFVYIVCELPPSLIERLETKGFKPTPDGEGRYSYNDPLNTYLEVIPYDKLLRDAKKRNRVLFESLQLPT